MSGENDFSKENFLKKIQEGDSTLLIVGAILMVIPLIVLLLLTSGKSDNKGANQRLKNLTQRKNVFNFATKDDKEGPKAAPSTLSRSSNWFGAKTEEQQISVLRMIFSTRLMFFSNWYFLYLLKNSSGIA